MADSFKKNPTQDLQILSLSVTDIELTAKISDGRRVSIPVAWFPRLAAATPKQLNNFKIMPGNYGIHWPEVDEDISVSAFVG